MNYNSLSGIVERLISSTMQKYGVGGNGNFTSLSKRDMESYEKIQMVSSFDRFMNAFYNYVFGLEEEVKFDLLKELEDNFGSYLAGYGVNEKLVSKHLQNANEELLNDDRFMQGKTTEELGRFKKMKVIFMASTSDDVPNIIRISLRNEEKEKVEDNYVVTYGNIDFCSDGRVIIHKFIKGIEKVEEISPLRKSKKFIPQQEVDASTVGIDVNKVYETSPYFMRLFDLADLKTTEMSSTKKHK